MAPLPHNNTALFYVDYSTGSVGHTMEFRTDGTLSPSAFGTFFDSFMTQVSALTCLITINIVRFQAQGTNVSNPVTSGLEGNTYGSGAGALDQFASSLNFVGRSTGGRRVKVSVFGYDNAFGDFRLTASESINVSDAVDILNGASGVALAIDNIAPTWYPYANISVNAYWQKELRP